MKILLLGSSGLLGSTLIYNLKKNNLETIAHSVSSPADVSFNIKDFDQVRFYINKIKPNIIINLIALTDVDFCEKNKHEAFLINTESVKTITRCCEDLKDPYFIHISTDHVYNDSGLSKENNINIINHYAKTKFEGEKHASKIKSICLRTNFFGRSYSTKKNSFSDWIVSNFKEKKIFTLFDDVIFNPLSMKTLSKIITNLIFNQKVGVFNVGSKNNISKANFGLFIAEHFNFCTKSVNIQSVEKYNLKTVRPKDMSMDCSFFEKTFRIKLPSIEEELLRVKDDYLRK